MKKSKYDFDESKIKGESFTFIVCYDLIERGEYSLSNVRKIAGVTKEKGIGAIKWWRRIMCDPSWPCFTYDPSKLSIFRKNGKQNKKVINKLILDQGGRLPQKEGVLEDE